MKVLLGLWLAVMVVSGSNAFAGAEQYQAKCSSCHGKEALGNENSKSPLLAGQFDWYIVSSVNEFQSGKRGAAGMKAPHTVSESDLKAIATYLSGLQ